MPANNVADHWRNMPEFDQSEDYGYKQIIVRFETKDDYDLFLKLTSLPLTEETKSTWFPFKPKEKAEDAPDL